MTKWIKVNIDGVAKSRPGYAAYACIFLEVTKNNILLILFPLFLFWMDIILFVQRWWR